MVGDDLLTEPVVAGVEMLHTRSGGGGLGHLDAGFVVFEHGSGANLGNAQVTQENAGTKSITSSIERREVLGVSGAGSDGGLATADVMDACASEERAVSSGGTAVVRGGAVVRQEVTVDVVVERLASAFVDDAGISGSSEPAVEVIRSIPMTLAGGMIEASESGDVVESDRECTTSEPQGLADARAVSRGVGSVGVLSA